MTEVSLTNKFLTLRKTYISRRRGRRHKESYDRLGEDSDFKVTFRQDWMLAMQDIQTLISDVGESISKLSSLHNKRLTVRFDNTEANMEAEIEELTSLITHQLRKVEHQIRSKLVSRSESQTEERILKNLQRQLASKVQDLSSRFRASQRKYLDDISAQKGLTSELDDILGFNNTSYLDELIADPDAPQLMQQQEHENVAMQERTKEIQKIAESINELASIFKDLATLVIDQGSVLDRIDYNLENVQIKTEKGLDELIIADKYAENSRSFKCILILTAIIFTECLILIWKHS